MLCRSPVLVAVLQGSGYLSLSSVNCHHVYSKTYLSNVCYLEYNIFINILFFCFVFHKQTFHELILDVCHLITAGKTTN